MMNIILQRVSLQASPEALFDTYLDSKKHAAVIGRKVTIKRAVGARFVAFDGIIAFDCTRCSRTGCISRITAGSIGWTGMVIQGMIRGCASGNRCPSKPATSQD